jgi:hypothetical protein
MGHSGSAKLDPVHDYRRDWPRHYDPVQVQRARFVQGELTRVRYVSYNRKLVEMDMLTGPYGAWHLRESSGEQGCWAWVAIGVVCGFAGYRQLAKARQGQTAARG